jgi:hypothetical protein
VGNSTDADPEGTSSHTYTWEQYDVGEFSGGASEFNETGPIVRSFEGTNAKVRYVPQFSDYIKAAGSTDWEKLTSINRELNFALTVRDNHPNGGQLDVDFMKITVAGRTPFRVINPLLWAQGSTQTIEWDVGETADPETINCQKVTIKLSTDGGLTFPITIASQVPNTGTYTYTVPNLPDTNQARLLVEAADNIFYDASDFNFTISSQPDFFITKPQQKQVRCEDTIAEFEFDYIAFNGFSEKTKFSVNDLPDAIKVNVYPQELNRSGKVKIVMENLNRVQPSDYEFTVVAQASSSKIETANLRSLNIICLTFGSSRYDTATTFVEFNTISNSSSEKERLGYISYRNDIITNVNREEAYPLTVRTNTDGPFTTITMVWIDWNQDCIFDRFSEQYNLGEVTEALDGPTSKSPFMIRIPKTAVLGETVMRVATRYKGEGDPSSLLCELGFDGEVEDYTLNIQPTKAVEAFGFDNLKVFPNPNTGNFYIKLNGGLSREVTIELHDIKGRMVYTNTYKAAGDLNEVIAFNSLGAGVYILRVSDGLKNSIQKVVVK